MIRRITLFLPLLLLSFQSHAESADQICSADGYYSGAHDALLSSLAAHILNQRKQLSTPACGALWREAVEVGENFSKTGKPRESDARVISEAANFSSKVYDAITKISGL